MTPAQTLVTPQINIARGLCAMRPSGGWPELFLSVADLVDNAALETIGRYSCHEQHGK